jgi:hypothetical protein
MLTVADSRRSRNDVSLAEVVKAKRLRAIALHGHQAIESQGVFEEEDLEGQLREGLGRLGHETEFFVPRTK